MKNKIEMSFAALSLKKTGVFSKRRTKQVLWKAFLCMILIFSLTGCGKENPRESMKESLWDSSKESFKEKDAFLQEDNSENGVKNSVKADFASANPVGMPSTGEVMTGENDSDIWEEQTGLTVYICGQVMNPGVFTLAEGSRINDVLLLAGGFCEDADISAVNLAQHITDGMKIYIPKPGEQVTEERAEQLKNNTKVNINQAGVTELCTLPGVGESRAKDIIAYREKNGCFQKIEDLMKVSGIKESTFQKVEEYICIGN